MLMGHGWLKLEPQVTAAVEDVLSGGSDDSEGKETLQDAWKAAQAVESFGGQLTDMLLEINDLCGDSGEVAHTSPNFYLPGLKVALNFRSHLDTLWCKQNVGKIPVETYMAVEAAHDKYLQYLSAFGDDEVYLRKKVELELGGVLLQIKQRLTGMDPKWSEVSFHCFRPYSSGSLLFHASFSFRVMVLV